MDHFRVCPLSESDIDAIVTAAGGRRAHEDSDSRDMLGADYLLAESLIELKLLDDEGLSKPERQARLASLFSKHLPDRPVIVLDRSVLPAAGRREYDRILEGPIKTVIAKARKQLKQSRVEHSSASSSVLFVINNGYTALDHEALVRMVAHRARNDSAQIDGVVVAGCYFYSDTFDSYFLWPIDYIPINIQRPFASYERLRKSWNSFSERFMTSVVRGEIATGAIKGPVVDTQFDVGDVTYVRLAPHMGKESEFFGKIRPRVDSSHLEHCPPVAMAFPNMTHEEWSRFQDSLPGERSLGAAYEDWQRDRASAVSHSHPLKPFVSIDVTESGWVKWCKARGSPCDISSVHFYANDLLEKRIRVVMDSIHERLAASIAPSRYVLAVTEEIGQDRANDMSHIVVIREQANAEPIVRELVSNARVFHEHATALASAYAVAEGVEIVLWEKDQRYAWI